MWFTRDSLGTGGPRDTAAVFTVHGCSRARDKEITPSHWAPVWTAFWGFAGRKWSRMWHVGQQRPAGLAEAGVQGQAVHVPKVDESAG